MLLVTSRAGANGTDFEKILAFTDAGKPLGAFGDDPRVVDPRGLGIDTSTGRSFVNSCSNRILALDLVRASRPAGTQSGRRQPWVGWALLCRLTQRAHHHGLRARAL